MNLVTDIEWQGDEMVFKNRENTPHNVNGKLLFDKRSVAVAGVVMITKYLDTYVLCSERGPAAPDYNGLMNLVAGYMDWNEWGYEAFVRECWEECGLNLFKLIQNSTEVFKNHLQQPWWVQTDPGASQQNVTLRYGVHLHWDQSMLLWDLPELTTKYNEIEGETVNPQWLNIKEVDNYQWAFNHDRVISDFQRA